MQLTQAEAAERLRVTVDTVKRLRLTGKLAYYKGRPVLIDEAAVAAYLESRRCPTTTSKSTTTAATTSTGPRDDAASASARARETWLRRRIT